MNADEHGVLLAVGPDGVRDGVLDFAAAEASRLGTGVWLLHVIHSRVVAPTDVDQRQAIDRALSKVGREVLTDAAGRLRDRLAGRHPVETEIATGPVAATICDRASGAGVVILERRDLGTVGRMLTMSVSTRVAAYSHAPVVIVPRHWAAATDERPVTVGVDHAPEASTQVEAAAAYARSVARPLVVLHAVWLAEPYQDTVFVDHSRRDWTEEAARELRLSLAAMGEREDLRLTSDVRWARPVDALVAASRSSSVLVLSRRDDRHAPRAHLGPVTRAVLQHAECPVLIVDRT
ncbi:MULTISPECIES: universal stress protein [unclassified Nocardioides]|uniref:universal stress protein n=1 Tax=unclassified Nocardioides TaxID=2615069 RepID=UPI003607C684